MPESNDTMHSISLVTRMIAGAVIGLVVICWFVLDGGHPAWGEFWLVRPMIIVPLAGAIGGLCNYFIVSYRDLVGLSKTAAYIISLAIAVIGLWLGIVLGLAGTMWN